VILFLNGAFGIGKTTVARALVARLPGAVLYDPEPLGILLQRLRRVDDFQDLALWRRLTLLALRLARRFRPNVIVPMAFSDAEILAELRDGAARFDPRVLHFCLTAPFDVVQSRLLARGHDAGAWELRRARQCCHAHSQPRFALQLDAQRDPSTIVSDILSRL
jgi:hypothetical protein